MCRLTSPQWSSLVATFVTREQGPVRMSCQAGLLSLTSPNHWSRRLPGWEVRWALFTKIIIFTWSDLISRWQPGICQNWMGPVFFMHVGCMKPNKKRFPLEIYFGQIITLFSGWLLLFAPEIYYWQIVTFFSGWLLLFALEYIFGQW